MSGYSATAQPADVSTSTLPDAVHDQTEYEVLSAYHLGYCQALADVAAGHVELGDAWQSIGRRTHEQRVAERAALFQQCAVMNEAASWRGFYPGGPVDFETGLVVEATA